MSSKQAAYARYQRDIALFSRDVIGVPLYRYQQRWAQHVLEAIAERRNEVIVIEQPRQSGKNEARAQLEVATLARYGAAGGEVVVTAPTWKPQIFNSKLRFELRSNQAAERLPFLKFRPTQGYMFRCARAGIQFLSAAPEASVVGATASLILEIDEAQDVDKAKFDKDFSPMRASTGAPILACGTTWSDDTLLERFKRDIADGRTAGQCFRVTPEDVAEENPAYWSFVQSEVARLGREHPLIKTQYFLELLPNRGRFLMQQQLRQLIGDHTKVEQRTNEPQIVAGLDWAGADEDAGELISLGRGSARDSVALTIGALTWLRSAPGLWEPQVRILARYEWTNVHPLSLESTLFDILQRKWRVNRLHADGTGIGATGTLRLAKLLDAEKETRVKPIVFDGAWNTATDLAFQYMQIVNGSRLLDYQVGFDPVEVAGQEAPDTKEVDRHIWWQRGHARLEARPNQRVRVSVPEGEGHDDLLISEMLMVDAAMAMLPSSPVTVQKKRSPIM